MIITASSGITQPNRTQYAWTGLKRFHNVAYVEDWICKLHELGAKDRPNAKKQASQIRYCLIQASEYFEAAAVTSLATKPNLLYYSAMSLALAEILLKQDGLSSLDKARAQHRHHGLELAISDLPKNVFALRDTAAGLRARPITGRDRISPAI